MDPLGPFGAAPRLAIACSGGADSTALTLLASCWAAARGGSAMALIVSHGLRPEAAAEATLTVQRLAQLGIAARRLALGGLRTGPGLAARARDARYSILFRACRAAGIVHLLLGHHAADQAETVAMRELSASGVAGLAGIAAIAEREDVRLLRPLLGIQPDRLRATLRAEHASWVEDPSNRDPIALRARLRAGCIRPADPDETPALIAPVARYGRLRTESEREIAAMLSERVMVHPEGFAVISPGPLPPAGFAALIQAISGSRYPPSLRQVANLVADPRPATLGGAQLVAAGRFGPGLIVVRESRAVSPPVPASPGTRWDGRFRLGLAAARPAGATIGALGAAAAGLRKYSTLPSVILRVMPALWLGDNLLAVPHIGYPDTSACDDLGLGFCPRRPLATAPWRADPGHASLSPAR